MSVLGKDHTIAIDYCPYCNVELDCMTGFDNDAPVPGKAITVCLICAEPLLYNEAGKLRKPETGELEKMFEQQPGLKKQLGAMRFAAQVTRISHPSGFKNLRYKPGAEKNND